MMRIESHISVFITICLLMLAFTPAIAASQLNLPYLLIPETQQAIIKGDYTVLDEALPLDNTTRDGYRMVSKDIDAFMNGSTWENDQRHLYQYEEDFMSVQSEDLTQNYTNDSWVNYEKLDMLHDDECFSTGYSLFRWGSNQWGNYIQSTYTLDASHNITETLSQIWQGGAWANYTRGIYGYNENQLVASVEFQMWQSGSWVNLARSDMTYNANGDVAEQYTSTWGASGWIPLSRTIYTYIDDELTYRLYQTWNSGVSMYQDYNKFTYTYEYSGLLFQELQENWQNNVWNWQICKTYSYDDLLNNIEIIQQSYNNGWLNTQRSTMVYEFWDVAIEDQNLIVAPFSVSIMPNPASADATVNIKSQTAAECKVLVFNTKGERLQTHEVTVSAKTNNMLELPISALKADIYIVQVKSSAGQTNVLKLTKL